MIRITGGIPTGPSFSVGFLPFSEELVQPHEGDVSPNTPLNSVMIEITISITSLSRIKREQSLFTVTIRTCRKIGMGFLLLKCLDTRKLIVYRNAPEGARTYTVN
jgi:hypothetical protein